MKKRAPLVTLTLLFAAFTLGFFLGRNRSGPPPQLSLPEQMLTAPTQVIPEDTEPPREDSPVFPIDLNTATEAELMELPGIGPVLAQRILAYRADHGGFSAAEELMNVEGIGEKRMEAVWDLITIGGNS